jgi:hydrogenase 3 maturation protease
MLNKPWLTSLKTTLERTTKPGIPIRLAVLGIGHELGGDDAAGVRVAGLLRKSAVGNDQLLSLEAGPAPENFIGKLRSFHPSLVLLVDAALMNSAPGTIQWLDWQDTQGFSASTHTLPLHILASYLTEDLGCEVALIGIQPRQTFETTPLTPEVRRAVRQVARELARVL